MKTTLNQSYVPATGAVSRRSALRSLGGASVATALAIVSPHRASAADCPTVATPIEPHAGSWRTWILASGDELRPAAPPGAAQSQSELATLRTVAATRDADALDSIAYWDTGSPGYRWNELAMQQTLAGYAPGGAYRAMALLNAAIYDAIIAAWDAKYAFNRPRPAVVDPSLQTVISTPASPSYPCEHAVTAGAATTVLSYLFPDDAATFASWPQQPPSPASRLASPFRATARRDSS